MRIFEWALIALIIVTPWGEGGAEPTALAVVHTIIFAAAAIHLRRSAKEGGLEARLPWPIVALLPFLLVGAVSLSSSGYLYGSFETYWDQMVAFALAILLVGARPPAGFSSLAAAVVVGGGVAQAVPAIATRFATGAAVSPSFLNPNHLAAYLNVCALLALGAGGWLPGAARASALPSAGGLHRFLWRAGAIVCLAGVIAIASRGALLALALTLVIVIARSPAARSHRWLLGVGATAVLVVLGALSVQMRFAANVDPYRYDRPRLWLAALQTWSDHPVLGVGPGMYEQGAARHNFPQEEALFRYSKEPNSAHSQPLQTLAEEGIAGLAALVLFVVISGAAFARARHLPGERGDAARTLLPALIAVAIQALFETPFEAPALPLTLIILSWPVLAPGTFDEAAAAFVLRWPKGPAAKHDRRAIAWSAAAALLALYLIGVAAPYLSWALARYAEGVGRAPARVDWAARHAEALNPYQPFIGYRRARAALSRAPRVSPPLLANASDSLERTIRLEPGDPSAYALLGDLYARAAADLPGAGPGSLDQAERRFTQAIEAAPRNATFWVARAAFSLFRGDPDSAISDAARSLALEPLALAAHQVRVEALLAAGRREEAASALREMEKASDRLRGYAPLNGYEAALIRIDARSMEEARRRLKEG